LVTFAILARYLGTDQFALYVTLTAFTNVAVQICGLGSQESLVRRVARDPSEQSRVIGHALLLTFGTFAALVLAGMVALPIVMPVSSNPLANYGSIALLLVSTVFIMRFVSLASASYIARSNFVVANSIEIGFGLIRMFAAVLACLVFGVKDVVGWSVWFFAAHAIVALVCVPLIWRLGRPRYALIREELKIGALFSTQFIFKAIRQNTDVVVLGIFTGPEIVASYGVARRILDSSYLSIEALNRLIYPGSAVVLMGGFHAAYNRVIKVATAAVLIAGCAAAAVYLLAPLMPLLFGQEYPSLVEFTRLLCWVVVPTAMSSVVFEAFGAAGRQDVRAIVYNSANIVAAALVALAISVTGVDGAFASSYAVETLTAAVAWMLLLRFVRADRSREINAVAAQ
jgi:O-antigen/teichoic acid export membrane protein